MATIKITPEMMLQQSKEIAAKIDEWRSAVSKIYQLKDEMDAMWDGDANDSFNASFNSDRTKYEALGQMMTEYATAIQQAASKYVEGESEVKNIVNRGKK